MGKEPSQPLPEPASANSAPSRPVTSPGGRLPAARVHGRSVSGCFLESGAKKSPLPLRVLLVERVFKCWEVGREALGFPLKPLQTHPAPVEALLCRGLELWGARRLRDAGFGCWGCPKAGCAGTVLMDGAGPTLGLLLGAAQCPRGALGGWSCRNLVIWPLLDGNLLVLGTGCVPWSRWGCSERALQQSCYQFWL